MYGYKVLSTRIWRSRPDNYQVEHANEVRYTICAYKYDTT